MSITIEQESAITITLGAQGPAGNSASHNHTLADITDAGTAAAEDVGTAAGNVVQLDGCIGSCLLMLLARADFVSFAASKHRFWACLLTTSTSDARDVLTRSRSASANSSSSKNSPSVLAICYS